MNNNSGPSTRSIHLHSKADPPTGAIVPPIYDNAAFAYEDVDTMLAVALGEKSGNIYLIDQSEEVFTSKHETIQSEFAVIRALPNLRFLCVEGSYHFDYYVSLYEWV